jgi:hypothetical protein
VFVLDCATLATVALCAGYLAVQRISRIEPITALHRD